MFAPTPSISTNMFVGAGSSPSHVLARAVRSVWFCMFAVCEKTFVCSLQGYFVCSLPIYFVCGVQSFFCLQGVRILFCEMSNFCNMWLNNNGKVCRLWASVFMRFVCVRRRNRFYLSFVGTLLRS